MVASGGAFSQLNSGNSLDVPKIVLSPVVVLYNVAAAAAALAIIDAGDVLCMQN